MPKRGEEYFHVIPTDWRPWLLVRRMFIRRSAAAAKLSWIRKNSAGVAAEFLRIQLRNARKKTRDREVEVRDCPKPAVCSGEEGEEKGVNKCRGLLGKPNALLAKRTKTMMFFPCNSLLTTRLLPRLVSQTLL